MEQNPHSVEEEKALGTLLQAAWCAGGVPCKKVFPAQNEDSVDFKRQDSRAKHGPRFVSSYKRTGDSATPPVAWYLVS